MAGLVVIAKSFGASAPSPTVVIGDSRSANRNDGQTPWPEQVMTITITNLAVPGTIWSQIEATAPADAKRIMAQGGVNDIIIDDANGATLWETEQTFAEARALMGLGTYVFDMPGFTAYDPTPSRNTQRLAFNAAFAAYEPSSNLIVKVSIAAALTDGSTGALFSQYSLDGLHFTTAGHTVIATAVNALLF